MTEPSLNNITINFCYCLYQARDKYGKVDVQQNIHEIKGSIRAAEISSNWSKNNPPPDGDDIYKWEEEREKIEHEARSIHYYPMILDEWGSVYITTAEGHAYKFVKIDPDIWLIIDEDLEDPQILVSWNELVKFVYSLRITSVGIYPAGWHYDGPKTYDAIRVPEGRRLSASSKLPLPSNKPTPEEVATYVLLSLFQNSSIILRTPKKVVRITQREGRYTTDDGQTLELDGVTKLFKSLEIYGVQMALPLGQVPGKEEERITVYWCKDCQINDKLFIAHIDDNKYCVFRFKEEGNNVLSCLLTNTGNSPKPVYNVYEVEGDEKKPVEKKPVGKIIIPMPGDIMNIRGKGADEETKFQHAMLVSGNFDISSESIVQQFFIDCMGGRGCKTNVYNINTWSSRKDDGEGELITYIGPRRTEVQTEVMKIAVQMSQKSKYSFSSVCKALLPFGCVADNKTLNGIVKKYTELIESGSDIDQLCSSFIIICYLIAFSKLELDLATHLPLNPERCLPRDILAFAKKSKLWKVVNIPNISKINHSNIKWERQSTFTTAYVILD